MRTWGTSAAGTAFSLEQLSAPTPCTAKERLVSDAEAAPMLAARRRAVVQARSGRICYVLA
jgi:hypothetical protein